MKKIIVILCLLILTSCSSNSTSYDAYYEMRDNLISQTVFADDYPFNVYVVFNALDDYYRYDVIIDEAQVNMYNITAMAYCDEDNNDSCPVIGLFDEETFNLIPNKVDKDNDYYKGIQLSGSCDVKQNVKVYICYYLDEEQTDLQQYFIEVMSS